MWLGDDGYEGYLEICSNTNTGTQWRPVCGGELWTDTEATVACNQLGYPNTTTLGKSPQAITIYLAIIEVAILVEQVNYYAPRSSVFVFYSKPSQVVCVLYLLTKLLEE